MITRDALASLLPTVAPFAAAGFVLGTAYFASLRRGVRDAVALRAWRQYLLLALTRVAAAALFFAFAVRWGAPALLAAFAGFLAARQLAVGAVRRLA
ncbi:MAG TPA: ATP synthase subunit I [Steroidobacteraceae bacterium]|nr:ATP synthase subunit I [Steroidobacteraceae bacterium]